jgi:hypothetical protein
MENPLYVLIVITVLALSFLALKKRRERKNEEYKKSEEYYKKKREEDNKNSTFHYLKMEIKSVFSVDLELIKEMGTQDEIVRTVNLYAYKVAEACVNQDKFARGEKVKPYTEPSDTYSVNPDYSWNERTHKLKKYWSEIRKLAIQALPELEKRIPHFSEFEPLKSYNEEHLRQKSAAK